jgi:hypothetical protein
MSHENVIRLASKMYEARESVRFLLGDKFKERMAVGIENLKTIAAEHNITVLEAAQRCAKMYADQYNGTAAMLVIAAAVEHAEPSP